MVSQRTLYAVIVSLNDLLGEVDGALSEERLSEQHRDALQDARVNIHNVIERLRARVSAGDGEPS
jgi:hypothetical protein